ncbi:ATP-binding protein [Desulfomonile tiedjei]|uniref:histidine kinase n=1 Tax=Desulfomonile tiedjei (strain ATCC 49306 / DSM 6799 / DCB-1) TaxID=706587 RepID=I4C1Y4_DESTA|nr:ATP-binding protein [Desulfomonile tiedjei]AFM23575.1 PAS domain S-box [Desulfomonile tiedjei DSM 6799]
MRDDSLKHQQTGADPYDSIEISKELEELRANLRWAQGSQALAVRILTLLNQQMTARDAIRQVLALVKEFTGFEAVAIRLRQEDDFPYFVTQGFPEEFVEAENSLCDRDEAGEIIRDPAGNPILECMCGNILCGRTDPSFSFFTEGGSFWSCQTTELLATTSDADRQTRTRNRCNASGYESVALIPLRSHGETVGLLQLNDFRKDCFTLDMVTFFEGIGASIGVVLARIKAEEALLRSKEELELRVLERTEEVRNANERLHLELEERKRVEQALRESEEKLRLFIEHAPTALAMFDREMRYCAVSHRWRKDYHLGDRDIIGRSHYKIFSELPERWKAAHRRGLSGEVVRADDDFVTIDGSTQWLRWEVHPWFATKGTIGGIIIFTENVTERKRAEEALRKKMERLRILHEADKSILEAIESPESIAQTVLGRIRRLLKSSRASIGIFDSDTKTARIFAADVHGESIIQVGKILSEEAYGDLKFFEQQKMDVVEDLYENPSPSPIARVLIAEGIRSYINVPLLAGKELIGVLNISWENSRTFSSEEMEIAGEATTQIAIAMEQARMRKELERYTAELEDKVRKRTAQLEAANKELEAFSYSVSHDLRAPLRAINGYTRILLEDHEPSLNPEGKRVCSIINESAQMMAKLIDDLLALSRVGRMDMQLSSVDMQALVNSIYLELTTPEDRMRIDIRIGLLPGSSSDPRLIRQVWINLLSNAIKFSSRKDRPIIEVKGEQDGDKIVYSIHDNGAGFDMKYVNKLFGVFQRLHSKREFDGTGVGLAIVHRIVHRHHGEVWAKGETGIGASFHFTLPKGDLK